MSGGPGAVRGCPFTPVKGMPELDSGARAAYQRWPLVSELQFGPLPTAVPCARLHTKNVLFEWRLTGLADNAELIVSELMTNAVKASGSFPDVRPVALRLLADRERLIIEVWDHSQDDPHSAYVGSDSAGGRGLVIVEALSARWGVQRTGYTTKFVWCELIIGSE